MIVDLKRFCSIQEFIVQRFPSPFIFLVLKLKKKKLKKEKKVEMSAYFLLAVESTSEMFS